MSSDEDDLAAILDLPPVKVKTDLRKGIDMTVLMSEEEELKDDRCEVANTITEINMTKDAKDKIEEHEKVPIEIYKIVIKRLFNKEKPDQEELCETITVGTSITCRTCLATEIEGEVLAFNTHTRMVIIKPTPILGQTLRTSIHMVNLDFIEDIKIVRLCDDKPPQPPIFDEKGLHISAMEGDEADTESVIVPGAVANTSSDLDDPQNYCVTGQMKTADDAKMLALHKIYKEEVEDKAYTEKDTVLGIVTYIDPQNHDMPSQMGV
jgi:hypothetical protein